MTKPDDNGSDSQRSEKIRKIIGERLPFVIRHGTVVLFIIFLTLLTLALLAPFPHGNGESIGAHIFR